MATIYRVMKGTKHGRPAVGVGATSLGVRIPRDIEPARRMLAMNFQDALEQTQPDWQQWSESGVTDGK